MKVTANTLLLACILLMLQAAAAGTVTVAVASNFSATAEVLANRFHEATGHIVRISAGSSSKLYAQIVHGAPFDVFLSADEMRPARVVAAGLAVAGSRFNYADGQLVLWTRREAYRDADCLAILKSLDFDHLAIANPRTAPYGAAAQEWLQAIGLWEKVQPRIVMGENISQTFHFTATRNAALGLIAASQLTGDDVPASTCQYAVPTSGHRPIRQQAVLLKRGADNPAATEFFAYLQSPESAAIIRQQGYRLP